MKSEFPRPGEMPASTVDRDGSMSLDDVKTRAELTTAGTLGALEYVRARHRGAARTQVGRVRLRGLRPRRRRSQGQPHWSAFTRVMDRANRAGVVVYSLDARGLQTGGLTAEDNPQVRCGRAYSAGPQRTGRGDRQRQRLRRAHTQDLLDKTYDRKRELMDSQDALVYMAEQTGGFAVLNTNDLLGRHRAHRRRRARLLPDRLRDADPDRPGLGPQRRPRAHQAPRPHSAGAARPLRPVGHDAAARSARRRSPGRRRAVAVRVRRHRRAPHHAVRARRQGRLLRPLAVLHRSRRPDVRRRAGRPQGRRPHAAAPRHRRQRPRRRSGAAAGAAAARPGRVSACCSSAASSTARGCR